MWPVARRIVISFCSPKKAFSREHFKISFINGSWIVDVVSRYGEVIYNGEQVQQITLVHGSQFAIPPMNLIIPRSVPR